MTKRQSLQDLSRESRRSVSTLRRMFQHFLLQPPHPRPSANPQCVALIDGTYFRRIACSVVYYDHKKRKVLWWRQTTGELAEEIVADLESLREAGVVLIAAVTDGRKSLIKAIKITYPDILLQRCLVHLERQTLAWLTQRPKYQAGRELRALCRVPNLINSKRKRNLWLKLFALWCKTYDDFLKERTTSFDGRRWRYTHRNLRRVRKHLLNARPHLFTYLDHPQVPKDTNQLEGGVFSPLKEIVRSHRGIPKIKRPNFLAWYFHFKYQSRT